MNIYQALEHVPKLKAEYFKWKHDIRFDRRIPKKSDEDFLRLVDKKTLNSFIKWEKSSDYKQLLSIYLDSCIANDMDEIYKKVSEQAKTGDAASVKLFLQMQKDISVNAKNAITVFKKNDEEVEIEEDDGLEL